MRAAQADRNWIQLLGELPTADNLCGIPESIKPAADINPVAHKSVSIINSYHFPRTRQEPTPRNPIRGYDSPYLVISSCTIFMISGCNPLVRSPPSFAASAARGADFSTKARISGRRISGKTASSSASVKLLA